MKNISLKEISRLAGVASSTVSLILNGKAEKVRISKELEKKVIAIAKKEGYKPNLLAISLRTGKSNIIGLVVESISGQFFASLAKVIEDEAERHGYRVVYCSTENEGKKGSDLLRMLSQRQVDGYLVTPVKGMEDEIKAMAKNNKPMVMVDNYFAGLKVPAVMVDGYDGIKKGMNYLLKKGFKKIAFVTIEMDHEGMNKRREAYLDSLKEAGFKYNKKLELKLPYTQDKEDLIKSISEFLKTLPKGTAVFFATNYLGIAGLESCTRLKLKIPADLSVITFDDDDLFRLYPPGITTIQQPVSEIAKTAIELLVQQINNSSSPLKQQQILLPPKLMIRGSV